MSIIYDDLGEWIREYYEDADCTIEKTSDEISEVDPLQTTLKSELDYLLALLILADRLYNKIMRNQPQTTLVRGLRLIFLSIFSG